MPELTPEMKKQLEEQKKQCIFCKILEGEIESKKVYEDKHLIGILDINPAVEGHTIIVPKEHYPILPFLPEKTQKHLFEKLPALVGAVKKAMVATGSTVFVANGGAAGQRSPHFMLHILPREKGDGLSFDITGHAEKPEINAMLAQNFPKIMQNHFAKNPASWHKQTGKFDNPRAIYQDEKVVVFLPEKQAAPGHVIVNSREEENFSDLSPESSAHLFQVSSYLAQTLFQALQAHGSNIIVKSGKSMDNDGKINVHVIPRFMEDGLELMWQPMKNKPNLDEIQSRIKDKTFAVQHSQKKPKKPKKINLDKEPAKLGRDPAEEIINAIRELQS